ncbi:DUF1176 domain-containing protein [Gemmobacter denitrificans]|uniref:DUF1176 domain-containing protein n=1 Tax=Gemmobacter denitrificans TaxID=3123040 RepID=A0ABU8BUF0_9RHOB
MTRPFALLALPLCLMVSPVWADPADDAAIAAFSAAYAEACAPAFDETGKLAEPPQRLEMTSPNSWGGDPTPVTLWHFTCMLGAYNMTSVVMVQSPAWGLVPQGFARPDLTIVTEDPANPESPLKEVKIAGWSASPFLVNAEMDAATGRVFEFSKWRGLGDASSTAEWQLVDEGFRLIRYEVDASYDDQINPVTLIPAP